MASDSTAILESDNKTESTNDDKKMAPTIDSDKMFAQFYSVTALARIMAIRNMNNINNSELTVGCFIKLQAQPECVGLVLRLEKYKIYGDSYRVQFKDSDNKSQYYSSDELIVISPESYDNTNTPFKVKINKHKELYRKLLSQNVLADKILSYDYNNFDSSKMDEFKFELIERTNNSAKRYFEELSVIRSILQIEEH